jgi:hypothetical protein
MHNWYRRYIRYKCNRPCRVVGVYAIEKLRLTGEDSLTGKV